MKENILKRIKVPLLYSTLIHLVCILSIPFQLCPSVSTFKNKDVVMFYMQFLFLFSICLSFVAFFSCLLHGRLIQSLFTGDLNVPGTTLGW